MKTLNLDRIIRPNIRSMKPYSSARSEFVAGASVMLDANENSLADAACYNRYPDPLQQKLKQRIGEIKGVAEECIFIGNGSDEAIDLLLRATCRPGKDAVLICPPTYGMYEVAARIQDAIIQEVPLLSGFQLDVPSILEAITVDTKLLFLCSPNNPTGNLLDKEDVAQLLAAFDGLLILDEAYIDFAEDNSWLPLLSSFPNLVILQTFSKAWGMAGVRLGLAFGAPEIISILNKIKAPYNISEPAQHFALQLLSNENLVENRIAELIESRDELARKLQSLRIVEVVFPSDANFLLVQFRDADRVFQKLIEKGIVVRNRSSMLLCENCLRITIGTRNENESLFQTLQEIQL